MGKVRSARPLPNRASPSRRWLSQIIESDVLASHRFQRVCRTWLNLERVTREVHRVVRRDIGPAQGPGGVLEGRRCPSDLTGWMDNPDPAESGTAPVHSSSD